MTQADLGDATGLTSVHVKRTLKGLKMQSIVQLRAGAVRVHDWERLVEVGDFDAGFMLLDGPFPRIAATA